MTESSAPLRLVAAGCTPVEAAPDYEAAADDAEDAEDAEAADDAEAAEDAGPAIPAGFDADELITTLYAENATFVLSYVTKFLHDRYLAEDVLQETMLRAWRYCARFSEQKGSVRGWLIKVAHNIAMDEIRRRRSRPAEVAEGGAPEAVVADHADAVVSALQVHHALSLLSPGHRAVLEQIYLHDRTTREAAIQLGIPEGTAFSRSHYAMRILRHELGVGQRPPGEPAEAAEAAETAETAERRPGQGDRAA